VAIGADGVMMDVHPHPETALCDGPQALTTDEIGPLVRHLANVAKAIDKPFARPRRALSAVGE
jgi:3-deoxy-7-phosphoheptulonate synthase